MVDVAAGNAFQIGRGEAAVCVGVMEPIGSRPERSGRGPVKAHGPSIIGRRTIFEGAIDDSNVVIHPSTQGVFK